jgi:hypothetical protein
MAIRANNIAFGHFRDQDTEAGTAHRADVPDLFLTIPVVEVHALRREPSAAVHAWNGLEGDNPVPLGSPEALVTPTPFWV